MQMQTEIAILTDSVTIEKFIENDAESSRRYHEKMREKERLLNNRIVKINEFLAHNRYGLKEVMLSDIKHMFEICLKKSIIKEALSEFLQYGEFDMLSVIEREGLFEDAINGKMLLESISMLLRQKEVLSSQDYNTRREIEKLLHNYE